MGTACLAKHEPLMVVNSITLVNHTGGALLLAYYSFWSASGIFKGSQGLRKNGLIPFRYFLEYISSGSEMRFSTGVYSAKRKKPLWCVFQSFGVGL